jgi:L-iditol 2-dehydrogenase
MEFVEIPQERDPGPGEVTVRIRACGICGSDLHWWAEGGVGARKAAYPCILGHEPAGEIAAIGPGVTDLRTGDRVAVEPAITCGACEFCRAGRFNLCDRAVFLSSGGVPGLFREYATIPAGNAEKIPPGFTYDQAVLVEPLSVIVHILEMTPVRPGATVAITGAGSIGMLMAAAAKHAGAARVWIGDRVPHRLALARRMGADLAVTIGELPSAVRDESNGRGADIVIDAAAKRQTVDAAIAAARKGAEFVLVGIPSERNMPVDLHAAMAKELRVQTIFRANRNGHQAIDLLASGAIPDHLITHRIPLEQTQAGFELLDAYADGAGKVVIHS